MHQSERNFCKAFLMSPEGFIKEAARLKIETDRSDRVKDCINALRHVDQNLHGQMLFLQNTLESQRQDEASEFQLLQANIDQALNLVRKDIGNEEELESEDKEYYQRYLNDLYGKINIFKALGGRAWDYILDEEIKLTREIDRFVSEIETWQGDMPQERLPRWPTRPFSASLPLNDNHQDDYAEVQVFRRFLVQFGGHTGGWSSNDQHQFVKILKKYKGDIEEASEDLLALFPDKTKKEIIAHNHWYKKYKTLKKNHIKALERWRENQKIKKPNEIKEEVENKIFEPKKDRAEEKARIRAWKIKKKAEEEEKKRQFEKKKNEAEEKRRKESIIKREIVEHLRKERRKSPTIPSHEDSSPIDEEKRPRPRTTPSERMRHFRQQDRDHVARLVELRRKRQQEKETQSLARRGVSAERDPSRVLRPTVATTARSKADEAMPGPFKPVPNIRRVPKLKIPEWRKNDNSSYG